jgi:hypothetical protein
MEARRKSTLAVVRNRVAPVIANHAGVRHNRRRISGESQPSSRRDLTGTSRAPQDITDTDVWGVSDPAGRTRGRECDAEAGSHTPLPCCDPVLGRLPGGTNRRRPGSARPASTSAPSVDCGASMSRSGCGRCQPGRIEYDLRSTKGNGAPEFRFPHPVPRQGRSMTAARGARISLPSIHET